MARFLIRAAAPVLLLLLLLAGCASSGAPPVPPVYDVAVQATLGARAGADAAATYDAWSVRVTSTAYAATRTVEIATAQANDRATATAGAQTATAQAWNDRATEQAFIFAVTREADSIQATATDTAQQARIVADAAADEATRQAIARRLERARAARTEMWNRVWPILLGVAVVAALVVLGFELADRWRQRRPVQLVSITPDSAALVYVGGTRYMLPRQRQVSEPAAQLALPAPAGEQTGPEPLPPMTRGHVLIAGETGSRKTTALRHILERRQNVVVLDPHDDGQTWPERARIVGGGRDFEAIGAFMEEMQRLLVERYRDRRDGRAEFEPVTVAVDEMPAIVSALGSGVNVEWSKWLREGRKVGLFFAVATQSTRVRSLGIEGEGDLLENFDFTLVLGKLAVAQYGDLVRALDFPAVLRTVAGARPVLLPPPQPRVPAVQSNGHRVLAPDVPAVETEWGRVEPGQVARIVTMHRQGIPNSHIETAVFNQQNPGGAAYYKVRAVLERFAASRVEGAVE